MATKQTIDGTVAMTIYQELYEGVQAVDTLIALSVNNLLAGNVEQVGQPLAEAATKINHVRDITTALLAKKPQEAEDHALGIGRPDYERRYGVSTPAEHRRAAYLERDKA